MTESETLRIFSRPLNQSMCANEWSCHVMSRVMRKLCVYIVCAGCCAALIIYAYASPALSAIFARFLRCEKLLALLRQTREQPKQSLKSKSTQLLIFVLLLLCGCSCCCRFALHHLFSLVSEKKFNFDFNCCVCEKQNCSF